MRGDNKVHLTSPQEISNEDFLTPSRDVVLPPLPENVLSAVGSQVKPVMIKKSIFEKNKSHHAELTPDDSRNILTNALYNPNLIGQSQPRTRPYYWLTVKTGILNSTIVIDIFPTKDMVEVVGWRYIEDRGLKKLERQAKREGGQILILSPKNGLAAALSALPFDVTFSKSKDTKSCVEMQANQEKNTKISKAIPSKRLKLALENIDETELITNKTQMNMKRTLTITVLLTAAVCGWAQTHFPKNYNIDIAGGVNDAGNYTPVFGVGYTVNNWFALYCRYSFATDKIEDGRLTYWEHTGEVYPVFTVLSYRDKWFVSTFAGIAYKHQRLLGIPTPSRDVTGHNFGGVAGVEGEWHFARFLSVFGGVSYRGLFFKEEPRYEPFANVGVRTSMRVFRKAGRRR
jgi:hypothetical protein